MAREVLATAEGGPSAVRADVLARSTGTGRATDLVPGGALARDRVLPLSADVAGLFPDGNLRRGSTVVVGLSSSPGATSLALALLSGPSAAGSWCAVVGAPDLGLVAASQHGVNLERLALVPSPGAHWAVVTAALLEGFDVVLLCPAGAVRPPEARQLEARARERGSVLAVLGDDWPGRPDVHLGIAKGCWRGLEDGFGYLTSHEVEVVAGGRGAASRPRRGRLGFGGGPLEVAGGGPLTAVRSPGPVISEVAVKAVK